MTAASPLALLPEGFPAWPEPFGPDTSSPASIVVGMLDTATGRVETHQSTTPKAREMTHG